MYEHSECCGKPVRFEETDDEKTIAICTSCGCDCNYQ